MSSSFPTRHAEPCRLRCTSRGDGDLARHGSTLDLKRVVGDRVMARRNHAVSRARQDDDLHELADIAAARRRAADRDQRRALCLILISVQLHDVVTCIRKGTDVKHGRAPARSQCRASSEAAQGNGAPIPPLSRSRRGNRALARADRFHARPTALRISARASAARAGKRRIGSSIWSWKPPTKRYDDRSPDKARTR